MLLSSKYSNSGKVSVIITVAAISSQPLKRSAATSTDNFLLLTTRSWLSRGSGLTPQLPLLHSRSVFHTRSLMETLPAFLPDTSAFPRPLTAQQERKNLRQWPGICSIPDRPEVITRPSWISAPRSARLAIHAATRAYSGMAVLPGRREG